MTRVTLDRGVASRAPLWRWLRPRLRTGSPDGPQPTWSRLGPGEHERLDTASLRLADGLVSYVVEVVQSAVPAVTWQVGNDPHPRFLHQNHPMLTLGDWEEAPAWTVGNLARQVFADWPPSDDRLESAIGHWVATLAEANGSAQTVPTESAYEVSDLREEGSGPADFDFEVSLHEEIADEELVDEVAAGLRAAAGVLEVHVEDREVLLVRAPDWDEHRLVRWLDGNLRRP